jgi:hypothetical protein
MSELVFWGRVGPVRRENSPHGRAFLPRPAVSGRVCVMTAWSATTVAGPHDRLRAGQLRLHSGPGQPGCGSGVGGAGPTARPRPPRAGRHPAFPAEKPDFFGLWRSGGRPAGLSWPGRGQPGSHQLGERVTTLVNHHFCEPLTEPVIAGFSGKKPGESALFGFVPLPVSPDSWRPSPGLWLSQRERTSE